MDKKKFSYGFILILVLICSLMILKSFNKEPDYKEIEYNEFINMIETNQFEHVLIDADKVVGTLISEEIVDEKDKEKVYTIRTYDENLVNRLLDAGIDFKAVKSYNNAMFSLLLTFIPIIFLFYMMKRMHPGMNATKNIDTDGKKCSVKFDDVAGEDEAKESLMEIVDFLHNPGKYNKLGAKLPKGALLVGPPGTGKTLLAKAVAGEAGVPFYYVSGSEFVEMFVGVGAGRVRTLFKQANKTAPCIIFIDEIDAIGKKRDSSITSNDERENSLNQLLSEMDGFDPSKGIIVLGATNRPEMLDDALLRPGRFDRRIEVNCPDLVGREEILRVHLKNIKCNETVDIHSAALATAGASGADLANMVNEAAIAAARNNKIAISQNDLLTAIETVLVGKEKKNTIINEKEKRIVAFHETGHALVAALINHTEPVQKITIIPRTMGALGFVLQTPEKECFLKTKDELNDKIAILLAGRAAEEICIGSITTGASNDIEEATKIAKAMITEFGMSEKFGLVHLSNRNSKFLNNGSNLDCGEGTIEKIDEEINKILMNNYERSKLMIRNNIEKMNELAGYLIEHETITGNEFMNILNG